MATAVAKRPAKAANLKAQLELLRKNYVARARPRREGLQLQQRLLDKAARQTAMAEEYERVPAEIREAIASRQAEMLQEQKKYRSSQQGGGHQIPFSRRYEWFNKWKQITSVIADQTCSDQTTQLALDAATLSTPLLKDGLAPTRALACLGKPLGNPLLAPQDLRAFPERMCSFGIAQFLASFPRSPCRGRVRQVL
jgi:hypothetical protein